MRLPRATLAARTIREQIRQELNLTASAGAAPNKFLAKLASDWRKPDGLFVIQPEEVDAFLLPLPVGRLPGVGKVTEEALAKLCIRTVGELRGLESSVLEDEFGRYGLRLYELARGIDDSEVVSNRPTQSMSIEDTFEKDVLLLETEPMIRRLAEKLWSASRKESRIARTVVLKLKTSEFKILTRRHTPHSPPSSCEVLTDLPLNLRHRLALGPIEFEPELQKDMPAILDKLIPPSRNYGHEQTWHDGNGHSHLQATLLGPSLTVPIADGKLVLGTWQQIFHLECDVRGRQRTVLVTVVGD